MDFRQILFAASKGVAPMDTPHASWPEIIGDEMNSNPDMADGPWIQPAGSTISGGKMNWSAVAPGAGATNSETSASALISPLRYVTSFDMSDHLAGTVSIALGDEAGTAWGGNGTNLSEVLTAVEPLGDGFKIFNSSGSPATLSLDNVSVKTFQQMGRQEDWSFVGAIGWATDGGINTGILLDGIGPSDIASLTSTGLTAFDAANSTNTACNYTFYVNSYNNATSFDVRARGGSWVTVSTEDGAAPITVALTTGSGSGLDIRGPSDSQNPCVIYLIRCALA